MNFYKKNKKDRKKSVLKLKRNVSFKMQEKKEGKNEKIKK